MPSVSSFFPVLGDLTPGHSVFNGFAVFAWICAFLAVFCFLRARAQKISLEAANERLERGLDLRKNTEAELHKLNQVLQDRVAELQVQAERLTAERRLLETQKIESLGVLAGGVAHDFNNLLTGILGNASLARLELPSGHASVRSALDNLESAALRAGDLCKQMLAYSGRGRFVVYPLNLNRVVQETADLLDVTVSKKVSVQLNLEEPLPTFDGDVTQIKQSLLNLVTNASEAIGGRGGKIEIKTGRLHATREDLLAITFPETGEPGEYVYFEVSDDGPGLDPETRARIFDPFFTTKFTGRGLGLAAVLGIIRSHKGAIRVTSEQGRGTTFRILLPASEVVDAMTERRSPPLGSSAVL